MAIVNKKELLDRIGAFGDDDNVIGLLEDVTDTVDDYERRIAESGDWERKYNDLDSEWRTRYRGRFLEGMISPGGGDSEIDTEEEPIKTFEELFEEV